MLAAIGQTALLLALLGTSLGSLGLICPMRRGVSHGLAIAVWLCLTLAFAVLVYAYARSDFSLLNVYLNSHTAKPLLYKITGAWGNHEGSMLLWLWVLASYGAAFAIRSKPLSLETQNIILAVQAMLMSGFLLFILLTSNPFVSTEPLPTEGQGLNPLLQDIGLAIHPPMLYLGYVGCSLAFSFAIAALMQGRVDKLWARALRPWVLAAWSFLTAGIVLGSWWAYRELGWGGYWFWDPVENASLLPWFSATALLHALLVLERKGSLPGWCVLLAILTFGLSVIGTFLVRSGVLTSVHSFANDPERGVFILGLLALILIPALLLYALRRLNVPAVDEFAPVSIEGGILANNMLLASMCAIVLLGTVYPILSELLAEQAVSVGPGYFNAVLGPIAIIIIVLAAIGPSLPWKQGKPYHFAYTGMGAGLVAAGIAGLLMGWQPWYGPLGCALALYLLSNTLNILWKRSHQGNWQAIRVIPRRIWAMLLAHSGMAVMVLGITVSSAWVSEKQASMQQGDIVRLNGYELVLRAIHLEKGPNYVAERLQLALRHQGRDLAVLSPERRLYPFEGSTTVESAIYGSLKGDVYVVTDGSSGSLNEEKQSIGEVSYTIRLYIRPLVWCIWLGAAMMALGGLVGALPFRRRNHA